MQNGHFRELYGENYKVLSLNLGKFTFLVQTKLSISSPMLNSLLGDMGNFFEYLYGPCDKWDKEILNLKGTTNVFKYFLEDLQSDLGILIGGYKHLHLQKQTTDHLDWLLMQLETQAQCKGTSTMLLLDDVVLTSRLSIADSRMVVHFIKSFKPQGVHFFPVYSEGVWRYLYIYPLEPYTLVLCCPMDTLFSSIADCIEGFRLSLQHSRLDIPIEDVRLPLRQFAKRDTLALLYHNVKTGITLMPALRPGPDNQTSEILKGLVACVNESSMNMQVTGTSEWIVYRRQHMYFARSDGVDRLFLLVSLANGVIGVDDTLKKADDIIKSIRKLYHQL